MIFFRGFSLIEMLITLTIIALLATVSFPAWQTFLYHTEADMLRSELLTALEMASQEARHRGVATVLCQSLDGQNCVKEARGDIILFMDESQQGVLNSVEKRLAIVQVSARQGRLYWRSYPHYRHHFLFLPSGLLRSDNGTFWFCHAKELTPAWAIVLNKSGRPRVIYPDQNHVIKDAHNQILVC